MVVCGSGAQSRGSRRSTPSNSSRSSSKSNNIALFPPTYVDCATAGARTLPASLSRPLAASESDRSGGLAATRIAIAATPRSVGSPSRWWPSAFSATSRNVTRDGGSRALATISAQSACRSHRRSRSHSHPPSRAHSATAMRPSYRVRDGPHSGFPLRSRRRTRRVSSRAFMRRTTPCWPTRPRALSLRSTAVSVGLASNMCASGVIAGGTGCAYPGSCRLAPMVPSSLPAMSKVSMVRSSVNPSMSLPISAIDPFTDRSTSRRAVSRGDSQSSPDDDIMSATERSNTYECAVTRLLAPAEQRLMAAAARPRGWRAGGSGYWCCVKAGVLRRAARG